MFSNSNQVARFDYILEEVKCGIFTQLVCTQLFGLGENQHHIYDLNIDGPRYFRIYSNSRCLSHFKHKQLIMAMMMRVVVGSKDHSFGSAPGAGGSEVNKVENGNKEGQHSSASVQLFSKNVQPAHISTYVQLNPLILQEMPSSCPFSTLSMRDSHL